MSLEEYFEMVEELLKLTGRKPKTPEIIHPEGFIL